jgi:hypothetical protein
MCVAVEGRADEDAIKTEDAGQSSQQPQPPPRKRSNSSEAGTPITPKYDDRIFFGSNFSMDSVHSLVGLPKPVVDGKKMY